MRSTHRIITAAARSIPAAALALTLLGLAGCAQTSPDASATISIGTTDRFTSYNTTTPTGAATGNANITAMTLSNFTSYADDGTIAEDTSFGSIRKISDDPLVVQYSLNDDATWSDGTPVDAADLLLDWAAHSGALNTEEFDPGEYRAAVASKGSADLPADTVFFDSGALPNAGLGLAHEVPQLGDDGRSMTLTYAQPIADWRIALPPPLPAHIVAEHALGAESAEAGKAAIIDAITAGDAQALSRVSSFWNTGFALENVQSIRDTLVSSGPYVIGDVDAETGITLRANPEYRGAHAPSIGTVRVRFFDGPDSAIAALADGDVDVISPQATPESAEQLAGLDNVTTLTGQTASFEHIDLQFQNSANGSFDDPLVREAFLATIPREKIVDALIRPIVGADAEPRTSFVFAQGTPGYRKAAGDSPQQTRDIDAAKKLLTQAGSPHPEVCILYAQNNPRRAAEFSLIADSARQAGFTIDDCGSENWRELLGAPGTYDAALFAWESTSLGALDSQSRYATGARNNLNGYSSDVVDALYSRLAATRSDEAAFDILTQIDEQLREDSFGMPLYQYPAITAFNPDAVTGIDPILLSPTVYWNVWDWTTP